MTDAAWRTITIGILVVGACACAYYGATEIASALAGAAAALAPRVAATAFAVWSSSRT